MSQTEVVSLTIDATEVRSISEVSSLIVSRRQAFADKYRVGNQLDRKRIEEDMIMYLVKRGIVRLEELEVSILDDGSVDYGNTVKGRRIAGLIFRIHYSNTGYNKTPENRRYL